MDAPTLELHETIIRLAKGILSAYEKWVKTKKAELEPYRTT